MLSTLYLALTLSVFSVYPTSNIACDMGFDAQLVSLNSPEQCCDMIYNYFNSQSILRKLEWILFGITWFRLKHWTCKFISHRVMDLPPE